MFINFGYAYAEFPKAKRVMRVKKIEGPGIENGQETFNSSTCTFHGLTGLSARPLANTFSLQTFENNIVM